jgi:hypothetical protein
MTQFWQFIHNALAHPAMAFTFNSAWSIRFHDWTGDRAWTRRTETT